MGENVAYLRGVKDALQGGGEPPNIDPMEARVAKLEEFAQDTRDRLTRIEARLNTFAETFATKADLHREINAQTWKLVSFVCGFGGALVAATFFIAKYFLTPGT